MKIIYTLFFTLLASTLSAQTIKSGVVVIGGNAAGVAAAIQAARSGVKTVLLAEGATLGSDIKPGTSSTNSGLWADLMKRAKELKKDSTVAPDAATTAAILKGITDTLKNLTVRYNSGYRKVQKSGKGWEIRLSESKTDVKTDAIVDATPRGDLAASAGVTWDAKTKSLKSRGNITFLDKPYTDKLYRTSLASGTDLKTGQQYLIPASALIGDGQSTVFITGRITATQHIADAMYTGQAAGALAAWCSFFKTNFDDPKQSPVRSTQGELLLYRSTLFPFTDIKRTDRDYLTFQHIAATGFVKATIAGKEFRFDPDSTMMIHDIRAAMREYHSRSQIWFADKKPGLLTVDELLSLIKYVAGRGPELDKEVEKGWKSSFGFAGKFDKQHALTRRELAVLVESFLQPFNVRINLEGNLGN